MPSSGVTALNGSLGATTWNVFDHFNGIEVNGVIGGRVDYSVGATAGNSVDTRSTENFYGHLGFKLGGMRLDGEGASAVPNAMRPWEELAMTVDGFVYRSVNSANFANPDPAVTVPVLWLDPAIVVGGNVRVQLNSLELNGGGYLETHKHSAAGGGGAELWAGYGQLAYVIQPYLVPAVRVEYNRLVQDGIASGNNLRILPGIASAGRPKLQRLRFA